MLADFPHWKHVKGPYLPALGTVRQDWIGNVPHQVSGQWFEYGRSGAEPEVAVLDNLTKAEHPVHSFYGGNQHDAAYRSTAGIDHPAMASHAPITSYAELPHHNQSHLAIRQPDKQNNQMLLYAGVAVAAYFLFIRQ
jgi:hypothetical protein